MTDMPRIKHFRPFLVCTPETYKPSIVFYQKIGCELVWQSDNAAELAFEADQRFLVTLHHGLVPTRVGVFHLEVENVEAWHAHMVALNLSAEFEMVKISEPEITEWNWQLF